MTDESLPKPEIITVIESGPLVMTALVAFIIGAALIITVAFILEKREAASNGDA